jgi:hypothetical protein
MIFISCKKQELSALMKENILIFARKKHSSNNIREQYGISIQTQPYCWQLWTIKIRISG